MQNFQFFSSKFINFAHFSWFFTFFSSKSLSFIEFFSIFRFHKIKESGLVPDGRSYNGMMDAFSRVQERDIITFVTNFSCWSVWKRDFLIKNGSRWTQNWKNGTSPKIMIFFIFCLYTNEKWKNHDFLGCHSSFLMKNHWKIMIFGFLWLQKMQKS